MNSKIINHKLVLIAIIMAFCLSIGVNASAVDVLSSDVMAYQGIFMKGDIFISVVLYTDDSEYPRVGGVTQINTPEIDQYGYAVGTQTGSFSGGLYQQSEGYYTKAGESEYGIIFKNGGISVYGINNADTSYAGDYIQVSNSGANMSPGDIWLRIPVTENSEKNIRVILDGSEIEFDVPPQIINDRTMVPLRAIFEALGYEVSWNGETNTASAKKGGHKICLAENMYYISCTGSLYDCDTAPIIVDDRLLIPARAVAECAGCSVEWDEGNKIVSITSGTPKDFSNFLESEQNKRITMDVDYDDTTQIYEKFRTEVFPETSEEFRTNKEVLSEAGHSYIDIDNDGTNELIIYFTTDSQNWGYMTIWKWKNDEHIMESLSVSVLERNSRPQQKEYVINYNNKNYLVYEYMWGHHGEKLLREEIFEYKDGWKSVYNMIFEGYDNELFTRYSHYEGVNRYFINGEEVDKDAAINAVQQLENAAVYNPAGGSMMEFITGF